MMNLQKDLEKQISEMLMRNLSSKEIDFISWLADEHCKETQPMTNSG